MVIMQLAHPLGNLRDTRTVEEREKKDTFLLSLSFSIERSSCGLHGTICECELSSQRPDASGEANRCSCMPHKATKVKWVYFTLTEIWIKMRARGSTGMISWLLSSVVEKKIAQNLQFPSLLSLSSLLPLLLLPTGTTALSIYEILSFVN